jgi:hypothetical protein
VISGPIVVWESLNPNVATIDVEGTATAVANGQVTVSATVDGIGDYALVTVAVPGTPAVNLFVSETSGTVQDLYSAWMYSPNAVFAAGADQGVHYDGSSWDPLDGPTYWTAKDMWGTSPSSVWAIGGNYIYHFDGTSWTQHQFLSSSLQAIWGSAPDDIWVVGVSEVHHFDGTSWTVADASNGGYYIWGFAADDIYISDWGAIRHYDGSTWSSHSTPSGSGATFNLWGTSGSDLYITANFGVYHYDGAAWSQVSTYYGYGLWGLSGSEVYAFGGGSFAGTTVFRYDGTTADTLSTEGCDAVRDITGIGESDIIVVCDNGVILRGYRGATPGTFGNATEGACMTMLAPSILFAQQVVVPNVMEMTYFGLITKEASSQVKMALYTDNAGEPAQLRALHSVTARNVLDSR